MSRRITLWLALTAAGLGIAALAAPAPRQDQPVQPALQGSPGTGPLVPEGPAPDLAILYTGSVVGYVEPCG